MSALPTRETEAPETGLAAIVTLDGVVYEVDPDTGEVLSARAEFPEFRVDSREHADWVLGKMMAIDAELAAIDTAAIVQQARAILENAEAKKKDLQRRRDSLEWRFGPELAEWAKSQLTKTKTWKGFYGSVSFRASAAKIKVADADKAAWWALGACPDAARVTFDLAAIADPDTRQVIADLAGEQRDAVKASFLVSLMPSELTGQLLESSLDIGQWGLERVPEGETVTIKTGVSK
ncbi:MAG: host-nuclease inhibitor Gam family protein [Fimbriimonadaceae bacterium]|nr:host-nuclease inhibitor Gam family protein [Fimbriimonadaceae bacterium]